jgi:hypothetical protein
MSDRGFDFVRLISPAEPDAFFRESWEKHPFTISRRDSSYYSCLLSIRDVDSMIYFTRPKFSGAQFETTPPTAVRGILPDTDALFFEGRQDITELCQHYAQGKSFLIHNLELRWLPVASLCRNLEAAFRHPVDAAMFLTPRGSQGFDPHFDAVDAFILQIEGSKHWRLYGPARELPLKGVYPSMPREQLGPPLQEISLEAGDLLYVPRGHIHEAFTSDVSSLHLTIAVNVFRWADLLGSALACVSQRDLRLREALPIGLLGGEVSAPVKDRFRELLRLLADAAGVEEAVDHLAEQFFGRLPALPDGHFTPLEEVERVGPDTVLEKRRGVVCRVIEEQETVSIRFPGGQVRGPKQVGSALRYIATKVGRFAPRSLPDDLSELSKVVLVRRLIQEGLLKVSGPAADTGD